MQGNWLKEFTPVERNDSADIETVVNSFEWLIYGAAGLMAISLFVIAANRSKNGDALGACFASLGAVLSAIAPIIAKTFIIGG